VKVNQASIQTQETISSFIFIFRLSGEVKVGDYGVERKLDEFLRSVNGYDSVSDHFAPSIGRGAKKTDIYRLGILILSLLKGQRITHNPPEFPSGLPTEIQDFLKK